MSPAKVFGNMNICKGDRVVLPSGRSGVVVEPAGGRVIPCNALVRLDKSEGQLTCIWVSPALLTRGEGK